MDVEAGVTNNASHRQRVDRIGTWDGENPCPVSHHDMLALADDVKSRLLQRTNGSLVTDTRKFGQF